MLKWSVTGARSVPASPGGLPVLGHLLPLLRDPLAFLRALPAHGDLVRIGLGPISVVMVCDPDLTEHVLRHDRIFDKGGLLYEIGRDVAGDSLPACPYSGHRRARRLLQPAFGRDRLPGYAQVMTERITQITGCWRDGQILDVNAETQLYTSSTTTAALFSDTVPDWTLRQALDDVTVVLDGIMTRALTPPPLDRLPTPANRAFRRAHTRLRATLQGILADRRRDRADHDDLLAALLVARDANTDGRGLTDSQVANEIIAFFMAGTETTATALMWALYLLDRHPAIADRLHSEVDTVLSGRLAHYADLPRLQLTGRIITETLRLYPPGWLFTRLVTEDTELGGHSLRAGTTIVHSPYLIHHRPDLYPQPERFDPDRWDPTRVQPARNAIIPFGGGARKCIGDGFAITMATIALATITARWQLHTLSGRDVRPARSSTLRPHKLHMRVTART